MDCSTSQQIRRTRQRNIVIVGGGPSGLVLAIALALWHSDDGVERDADPEVRPRSISYTIAG